MVFTSEIFILAFLPVTLLGFFLAATYGGRTAACAWLVLASLFFYGWWGLVAAVSDHRVGYCQLRFRPSSRRGKRSKPLLATGIVFNLGLLVYYKYTNFFLATASTLFGAPSIALKHCTAVGDFVFHLPADRLSRGRLSGQNH